MSALKMMACEAHIARVDKYGMTTQMLLVRHLLHHYHLMRVIDSTPISTIIMLMFTLGPAQSQNPVQSILLASKYFQDVIFLKNEVLSVV